MLKGQKKLMGCVWVADDSWEVCGLKNQSTRSHFTTCGNPRNPHSRKRKQNSKRRLIRKVLLPSPPREDSPRWEFGDIPKRHVWANVWQKTRVGLTKVRCVCVFLSAMLLVRLAFQRPRCLVYSSSGWTSSFGNIPTLSALVKRDILVRIIPLIYWFSLKILALWLILCWAIKKNLISFHLLFSKHFSVGLFKLYPFINMKPYIFPWAL